MGTKFLIRKKYSTMKFSINESRFCTSITLTPETPAEMAMLARATQNSKAEKPSIHLLFSNDNPYCHITMKKVNESKQVNSISNSK